MSPRLTLILVVAVIVVLLAGATPVGAHRATPEPGAGVPAIESDEVLAEVTLEETPSLAVVGFVTFAPGTRESVQPTPGATLQYVISGALTRRVGGSVTMFREGVAWPLERDDAGTPAGGGELVLEPGDALFVPEGGVPSARRNDGEEPATWLEVAFVAADAGGTFAEPIGGASVVPVGTFLAGDLAALGDGVAVELRRVVLPPDGELPAPEAGELRELATEPGPGGTVGLNSDGSATNLGDTPLVVYVLTLSGADAGTPAAGTPAP